jgi:hypothetical protein
MILWVNNWFIIFDSDDLSKLLFFDLVFTSDNIPYHVDVVEFGPFAVCHAFYYDRKRLKDIELGSSFADGKVFELIEILGECKYIEGQKDPARLFSEGGDCQALAVYFKTELDRLGLKNGFVASSDHVVNWIVVKGRLARVDIVSGSFGTFDKEEREVLEFYNPELEGVVDYVESG